MTVTATYDQQLSRVRVAYSGAPAAANVVHVQRSLDQITWTTVRGGEHAELASGAATVDDYEFVPNVLNYYRATTLQFEDFESSPLVIDTSGEWERTTELAHTGQYSYRSGATGPNDTDAELIETEGVDEVTLWYSVSSESGFDFFEILVETIGAPADQTLRLSTSGEIDWTQVTIDTAGFSGLRLRYVKDDTVSQGLDGAFVDDMRFPFTASAETTSITPTLDTVWLKFIARPFLNRPISIVGVGEVERPARNGVFDIVGRSFPVAVTELRGSRRWTITVVVDTPTEADEFDAVLASGAPVFVQIPPDCGLPRSMYAVIGDVTMSRHSVRSPRRYFELPLTEVAAPAPEIVGATVTWQSIVNSFATWSDLIAAEATWADVLERISAPDVVIVP